jgi:hypothetical protein
MKARNGNRLIVLVLLLLGVCAPSRGAVADVLGITAPGAPMELGVTLTLPEGATVYGVGLGRAVSSAVGIAAQYALSKPEEGDHLLHGFGGGLRVTVVPQTPRVPFDMSLLGSATFTVASGLPANTSMGGQCYTIAMSLGRFMIVGERTALGVTVMPSCSYSTSRLSTEEAESPKESSTDGFVNAGFSVIIRDLVSLTPHITVGEDLVVPGFSLIIRNVFSIRTGVARYDHETAPSFSIGLIHR